jgi:hypothetical protein
MGDYFRDVYDHLYRINQSIESIRDMIERAAGQSGPDRDRRIGGDEEDFGLGGDLRGSDGTGRHLGHELQAYAGAQLAFGYPLAITLIATCASGSTRVQENRLAVEAGRAARCAFVMPSLPLAFLRTLPRRARVARASSDARSHCHPSAIHRLKCIRRL